MFSLLDRMEELELEITSKCNARCPGCSRTVDGEVTPDIHVQDFPYEDFVKGVPPHIIKGKDMLFSGVYGDPVMHKDLDKIVDYLIESGARRVHIQTNGGIQTTDWWAKLGSKCKKVNDIQRLKVYWNLDGHRETNHFYRVNVNFDKALNNMRAFMKAGGRGVWQYLVFEHNKHEVELAKQEAESIPITFAVRKSTRNKEPWVSKIKQKVNGKIETKVVEINAPEDKKYKHSQVDKHAKLLDKKVFDNKKTVKENKLAKTIKCRLIHSSRAFLGYDGTVWPCCWFHQILRTPGDSKQAIKDQSILRSLTTKFGLGWNSIRTHSWEEILGGEYYGRLLAESWRDPDNELYINKCVKQCSHYGAFTTIERDILHQRKK